MIGSPDVVALTKEDDFGDSFTDPCSLPEEFSVPLFAHAANANPWTKTSYAKFSKDFILVSEFSEQVGPQPLLTIPNDPKVCGTFDLNYFSLRIMSVDYQASFVGHPPGSNYPKLNFVADSKVVLGDSKEGAFAYVHHLTLYDLEARGFVRPFCLAYISADERKIMHQFQELSSEFSKASEFLKSGNRKAFANELEKKLKDLEYTRSVLHKETELQKMNNGCYSTQAIEKANELANVEKSIYEHKDLLRQITSYPSRKKDVDFVQHEMEKPADTSVIDDTLNSNHSDVADKTVETESESRKSSYTPQLIKAKSAKCFDKRLKTMEELCDASFFHQTLEQLNIIEKSFRGDLCLIYTSQIDRALLSKQSVTSFLFEAERDWEYGGTSTNFSISSNNPTVPILNISGEPLSLDSYTTCIDVDHIKPGVESMEGPPESSTSDITQETSEAADTETKGSFSSDKSIEAFGGVSPSSLQANYFDGLERKSKVSIASPSENTSCSVAVPQMTSDGNLVPMDAACCIGQDGFIFEEPLPELAQECCGDTVVNQEPLSLLQGDPALQVDYTLEESALAESPNMGLTFSELNTEEVAKINIEDVSDSTSFMSASTSSDQAVSPFTYGSALTLKQKKKAGHSALRFIRQYPFAQQAIFCLLSGRTLVILGVDEGTVRKLVNALFIFVPNLGKYGETVQPWLSSPFQLTDLQRWKLIGLQRAASPAGSSILHSLNRYSRYISILDCDNKTLRCPPYKGTLVSHLADHRTQIKRGSTYFLHVQGMLTQLTAKAFLYTFCHHIHLPMDINDQGSVTSRRTNFLLQLGYTVEESKIVHYLSELIKQHYIQGSSKGGNQSFCFNYTTSYLYKI
ncbi:guanine nucleotide exchange protein smcr8a [Sinocyclocheilus rhinocerous]|uniref:Smith-Magenis syndrome chromosomal region candidate gene 8 protein homolog n=1 Tax=Sinocyclocheilus rhinocerous TaxID=307959 RepID=A0A673IH22_9TELE|nr:PREDICTED: Smith-Magenis syndrome chromosomal region candidate gene 8 protein homolog [Sinocyclocheilus rhinocerous]